MHAVIFTAIDCLFAFLMGNLVGVTLIYTMTGTQSADAYRRGFGDGFLQGVHRANNPDHPVRTFDMDE